MPRTSKTATKGKTAAVKKSGVTIDVVDLTGKVVGSVDLPVGVFGVPVNKALIAQAIRVYHANQRQGTAATKTRGEVAGSTRKIYRQKGTGRARHGGIRAPIFVHGGIAHGPKPHDHALVLPQNMRKAAMRSALSAKVTEQGIRVVDGLTGLSGKTKEAATVLKQLGVDEKKRNILFVLSQVQETFAQAVRNIEGVSYKSVQQLNTYDVLKYRNLIFAKDAIAAVEKAYSKGVANG